MIESLVDCGSIFIHCPEPVDQIVQTPYMRIDSHQHFWRYNAEDYNWIDDSMSQLRRDFLPENLKPELKNAGFDGCIAVQARQSIEETRWLLQLAARSPFILGVIGWVDLQSLDIDAQLQEFAGNRKLLGVRHVVQSEPDDRFLLRPEFLGGVAMVDEFDLTYDILIYPRHLQVAAEFVARFPRQRFVLDHLAKPLIKRGDIEPWRSGLRQLAEFTNVVCKLSGMITEANWVAWKHEHFHPYLLAAFECFGPERLMIGSDWPVCMAAASYSQTMNMVTEFLAGQPHHVRDAVLGGNAEKFWHLEPMKTLVF
jgi:L-fuconolactonase